VVVAGVWSAVGVQVVSTDTIHTCRDNVNSSCQASPTHNGPLSMMHETTAAFWVGGGGGWWLVCVECIPRGTLTAAQPVRPTWHVIATDTIHTCCDNVNYSFQASTAHNGPLSMVHETTAHCGRVAVRSGGWGVGCSRRASSINRHNSYMP
jgi:hypothetical protein